MLFVLNACFLFVHHVVYASVCPPPGVRMKLIKTEVWKMGDSDLGHTSDTPGVNSAG